MDEKNIEQFFDLNKEHKPYVSSRDHLVDMSKFCDFKIEKFYKKYIENESRNTHVENMEFSNRCELYIENRVKASLDSGMFLPLEYIKKVFKLDDFQYSCLVFSILPNLSIEYENIFELLNNSKNQVHPFFETLINLYTMEKSKHNNLSYLLDGSKDFFKYMYKSNDDLSMGSVMIPVESVVKFIFEKNYFEKNREKYTSFPEMDVVDPHESLNSYYKKLKTYFESNTQKAMILVGAKGIGKRTILKKAGQILQIPVTFINYSENSDFNRNEVIAKTIIDQSILVINTSLWNDELNKLTDYLLDLNKKIVIMLEEEDVVLDLPRYWEKINMDMPVASDNKNMWKAESENLSDEVIDWLCNRFRFTYGDIIEICSGIDKESRNLDETIKSVSRDYFKESLGDLVTSIKSPYTWDDLVVTKNVKKQLLNACSYVKYKNIVFEKMGLNAKVSYGKGLNILLKGSPGTGKTMAAQVIANHLDMELYKVDLSQIVSKYIGETEKNLNKIFDTCEGSGAVLFFDEMDALFSKRTEVKDSKDKNSNLEISFLLQRIEMYEGVVIMATNLLENVDEAFRRRIQYIVEFQIPTQNQRERILLNLLGGKLQTSEELDTKFISNFEIVGGEIKNIVLDSIFSALGNDDLLNNKYLILSTYRELEKQGKNPRMKDFGKYSYYIEEHYENYN